MTRLSSNHDKLAWLERLRKLGCSSSDVCQLRDECIKAYEQHLDALAKLQRARDVIHGPADSSGLPDAAAESLLQAAALAQTAQWQLSRSRQQTQTCAENEAVIRQRYKLR